MRDAPPAPPGGDAAHAASDAPLAVAMHGIEKSFGAVQANRGAELDVAQGEIHALVGENGAGKSTLMRLLAGLGAPDAGTIRVEGREVTGWSAAEAIAAGVGMVHQHFMLVSTLSVAENVVLGREPTRGAALDMGRARREVEALSSEVGFPLEARQRVGTLSVGEAQRVEILKVLFRGARLLILDEPTAVLSPPEVAELWRVLRRLREGGATVILITHKLDEVIAVADRVTVMRHGRTVARMKASDATPAEIARAMVGREVVLMEVTHTDVAGAVKAHEPPVVVPSAGLEGLAVRDLVVHGAARPRAVDGVSLTVAPGEVLGIAGVEGNGQTELVEALAGLRPAAGGRVAIGARDITALGVRERIEAGLAHIPEDRHRRGLVLDYPVADNLILGAQWRYARAGGMDRTRIAANAAELVTRYDIRPADPMLPARALSGGNQQKVVIAREMGRDFTVLLAAQPTRGVDVGAVEFIHAQLRAAREAGKAILLISAELPEVLALSDRVAVMYGGRIVAVLPRAEASADVLGPYMTGAASGQRAGAA